MENLFLVCLVPPASIVEDIDEIRNYISEKYQVYESLKRPAHITLFSPVKLSSEIEETKFFKALNNASFAEPFKQVLKNFNSFAPHTIYIDVQQSTGIMNLQAQISHEIKPLALTTEKNSFKFTPHLTIAFKDIKPAVFTLITDEYKDKKFKREFPVSGFSVYKHIHKRWQPYKEYPFKSPKDKPRPLSLFD